MKRTIEIEWDTEDTLPLAFISGLRDQAREWFENHETPVRITVHKEKE